MYTILYRIHGETYAVQFWNTGEIYSVNTDTSEEAKAKFRELLNGTPEPEVEAEGSEVLEEDEPVNEEEVVEE